MGLANAGSLKLRFQTIGQLYQARDTAVLSRTLLRENLAGALKELQREDVQIAAIDAMGYSRDRIHEARLVKYLQHEDPVVRRSAYVALARINPQSEKLDGLLLEDVNLISQTLAAAPNIRLSFGVLTEMFKRGVHIDLLAEPVKKLAAPGLGFFFETVLKVEEKQKGGLVEAVCCGY